jgi:predicted N-acetyltransferase YhbS
MTTFMENSVMEFTIRPAHPEHFGLLRAIELAAFETLRDVGAVTGEACARSLEELSEFSRNGLLLAAYTPDSVPVGFVAGKVEERWLHVAEMDVHPDWQRRGVGRQLMQSLLSAGQRRGMAGATLTTDNIAAFNARFYATFGFEIVKGHARPSYLERLNAEEVAAGFDPARRVAMWVRF